MSIKISVPRYEDSTDSNGAQVTQYVVRVEITAKNIRYDLLKRYSAFAQLHAILKEKHTDIVSFKFPNKSMFNTQSQFTKERRRMGFEDFLHVLMEINPLPKEVHEFLEIDTRSSNVVESSSPKKQAASATSSSVTATVVDRSKVKANPEPQLVNKLHKNTSSNKVINPVVPKVSTVDEQINAVAIKTLAQTFLFTIVAYAGCIWLEIIDISNTTYGRIFLTVLALGSAVSFIRIMLMKRSLQAKERASQAARTN